MTSMELVLARVKDGTLRVDPDGSIWKLLEWDNQQQPHPIESRRAETKGRTGYLLVRVNVAGQAGLVHAHRMVWWVLRGPIPEGADVNHRDGNKANNHPDNLELATRSENHRHAYRTGLRVPTHAISTDQVRRIKELRAAGSTFKAIAMAMGLGISTVHRAAHSPS